MPEKEERISVSNSEEYDINKDDKMSCYDTESVSTATFSENGDIRELDLLKEIGNSLSNVPQIVNVENSVGTQVGGKIVCNGPVRIILGNQDKAEELKSYSNREVIPPLLVNDKRDSEKREQFENENNAAHIFAPQRSSKTLSNNFSSRFRKLFSFCRRKKKKEKLVWVSIVIVVIIILVSLLATLLVKHCSTPQEIGSQPINHSQSIDVNGVTVPIWTEDPYSYRTESTDTLPGGHRIFSRKDWDAAPPILIIEINHSVPYVIISHTRTASCNNSKDCETLVKMVQDRMLSSTTNNYTDIGQNFLVGGDGNIYTGRGWNVISFHTGFVRNQNIAVGAIGNFIYDTPTAKQIDGIKQIILKGVDSGAIQKNYTLLTHNEIYCTYSPGKHMIDIVKTWPQYNPNITPVELCKLY